MAPKNEPVGWGTEGKAMPDWNKARLSPDSVRPPVWLLVMALFLLPCSAVAAQISDGRSFTLLCSTEVAGGFNWVDDHWEQARYKQSAYILRKKDTAKDDNCFYGRLKSSPPGPYDDLGFSSGKSCYSIGEVGEQPSETLCEEDWWKDEGLHRITCSALNVQRLEVGLSSEEITFVETRTYSVFMKPENGKRDSMVLEIGKCSILD
jgi:hypothetical protein